jgi:predicted secreted protein
MPAQSGRKFVLKTQDTNGDFQIVGGGKTTSLEMTTKSADVTGTGSLVDIPGTNQQTVASELVPTSGMMKLTGNGIFKDTAAESLLLVYSTNQTINQYQIVFEDMTMFVGNFLITQLKYTGDYNNTRQYVISLQSSGFVTFVTPPQPIYS